MKHQDLYRSVKSIINAQRNKQVIITRSSSKYMNKTVNIGGWSRPQYQYMLENSADNQG